MKINLSLLRRATWLVSCRKRRIGVRRWCSRADTTRMMRSASLQSVATPRVSIQMFRAVMKILSSCPSQGATRQWISRRVGTRTKTSTSSMKEWTNQGTTRRHLSRFMMSSPKTYSAYLSLIELTAREPQLASVPSRVSTFKTIRRR